MLAAASTAIALLGGYASLFLCAFELGFAHRMCISSSILWVNIHRRLRLFEVVQAVVHSTLKAEWPSILNFSSMICCWCPITTPCWLTAEVLGRAQRRQASILLPIVIRHNQRLHILVIKLILNLKWPIFKIEIGFSQCLFALQIMCFWHLCICGWLGNIFFICVYSTRFVNVFTFWF